MRAVALTLALAVASSLSLRLPASSTHPTPFGLEKEVLSEKDASASPASKMYNALSSFFFAGGAMPFSPLSRRATRASMITSTRGSRRPSIKFQHSKTSNADPHINPGAGSKRQSAISFWEQDMSGGAGSISSPNFTEHYKDASEAAMFYERLAAGLLEGAPPWLLFSTLAAVTREIASRRIQQGIVPLAEDPGARKKAGILAKQLRENFDNRIQNALRPGAYGDAGNFIRRIVDSEIEYAFTDIGGVVSTELYNSFAEVFEAETVGRVQKGIGEAVQLNQSSAEEALADIMTRADGDGNEIITFDEFYELVVGSPINPMFAPLAQKWQVLKSASTAENSWEMFTSLLIAPQIKRLSQIRAWYDENVDQRAEEVLNEFERVAKVGLASVVDNLRSTSVLLPYVSDHQWDNTLPPAVDVDVIKIEAATEDSTLSRRQKVLKRLHHCCPWKWKWRRRKARRLPSEEFDDVT